MYITKDYLYSVGAKSGAADLTSQITRTATIAVVAATLGGVVGYRHEKGIAPEKTMPSLGPVPADAIVGLGGHLLALSGVVGDHGSVGHDIATAAGDAGIAVFSATAGQSLGSKLAKRWAKAGTGGGLAQQLRGGNYRDAHGRYLDAHAAPPSVPTNMPSPKDIPLPEARTQQT